jgi:hypothetical protein
VTATMTWFCGDIEHCAGFCVDCCSFIPTCCQEDTVLVPIWPLGKLDGWPAVPKPKPERAGVDMQADPNFSWAGTVLGLVIQSLELIGLVLHFPGW